MNTLTVAAIAATMVLATACGSDDHSSPAAAETPAGAAPLSLAPAPAPTSTPAPLPKPGTSTSSGGASSTDTKPATDTAGKPLTRGVAAVTVSGDGKKLAYLSRDSKARIRLYVKDLTTKKVVEACATADRDCLAPVLSHDGRYVAYSSRARNLVAGDTNNVVDVFVEEVGKGTIRRVTRADGSEADRGVYVTAISADGKRLVVTSNASLDPDQPVTVQPAGSGGAYLYAVDLTTKAVTLIPGTRSALGENPMVSADGYTVVFKGEYDSSEYRKDTTLVADLRAGTIAGLVEAAGIVLPSSDYQICGLSHPSADGSRIAFQLCHEPEDEDAERETTHEGVYVADLKAHKTVYRVGTTAGKANRLARQPVLSADGRHVLFANGYEYSDTSNPLYVVEIATGKTRRVTTEATEKRWPKSVATLSSNGKVVAVEFFDDTYYYRRPSLAGDVVVAKF